METFFDSVWWRIATYVLVAVGTGGSVMAWNWFVRRRLRKKVEAAFRSLQRVVEPGTLNPAKPGNPNFMLAESRDEINLLRPQLERAGLYGPERMIATRESAREWFAYLQILRERLVMKLPILGRP